MRSLIAALFVSLLTLYAPSASAQEQVPATAGDSAELERLIETLEDPERRARLLTELRLLLQAQSDTGAQSVRGQDAAQPNAATGPVSSGSAANQRIGKEISTLVADQTDRIQTVVDRVLDAIAAVQNLPDWFEEQINDPDRRSFWLEIATVGLALPILVALIARWATGLLLAGSVRKLRDQVPQSLQGRLFVAVTRSLLEAFTVAAVLGAGWAVLAVVPQGPAAGEIAQLLIIAIAVHTGIGAIARLVLAPYAPHLRPLRLADEMAAYLYVWILRLSAVGVTGFVLTRTAVPLGAGPAGAKALEVAAAGVFAGLVLILVHQLRPTVRTVIRGDGSGPARRRFAEIWSLLASLYVLIGFGIFVSGAQDGFLFMVRATAITAAALIVAVAAAHLTGRALDRFFDVDEELERRFPGLRARSSLYRPTLKRAIDVVIGVVAAITVLEAWDTGLLEALDPETEAAILRSAGTIALVLILGVLAWELTASAIGRALSGTHPDGSPREASSRARTLLPLLRRTIMIGLFVFGGLIILSEVGINIAPLLAGAGVVGLAVGFGSQALVRDVITGLFILIEDTVAVGDVVTAGGHTGVVEDLSIRTIRLRDLSGAVHVVPFGDVTTVVNLTKDFSYAVLDLGVAYREDTDTVAEVIRSTGDEMQADPEWSEQFLEPIEIMGVNALADSAVVIRARIKTPPMKQWGVQREFLRRIKKRFDAENIEIPFPHTTVYFGVDRDGMAPAGRLLVGSENGASDPSGPAAPTSLRP